MRTIPPIHPGTILYDEFMRPLGITQYRLAKDVKVPETRIAAILKGKRRITPDSALRFSRYFKMSDRFFSNLQTHYDIETEKMKLGDALEHASVVVALSMTVGQHVGHQRPEFVVRDGYPGPVRSKHAAGHHGVHVAEPLGGVFGKDVAVGIDVQVTSVQVAAVGVFE